MRVVVIGVGNPWRRDDGVGWAVLDLLGRRLDGRAERVWSDGEPAGLIDDLSGADLAVVVDAMRTGSDPGTVRILDRLDAAGPPAGRATSHGLGLPVAVALATALGRGPARLVVVGIEVADVGHGSHLTEAVAQAVGPAADLVLATVAEVTVASVTGLPGGGFCGHRDRATTKD